MAAPKGHEPYKGCETGGRPEKYTLEFIEGEAKAFEKWMENPKNIFAYKFAFDRGYERARLLEFCEKSKKFSSVYSRAKERQENLMAEGALFGEYKEQMAKFLLVNHHGYAEKQQTELKGDGLQISLVDYSKKAKEAE